MPSGGHGLSGRPSAGVVAEPNQGLDPPGAGTGAPPENYFSRLGRPAAAEAAASTRIVLPGWREATIGWGSGAGDSSGAPSFAA